MFNKFFGAVYEIKWKNTVEPDRQQMITLRMHIACFITRAANTHCTPRICKGIAFPLLQWLHKCASLLRYTYIICLLPFLVKWEISCLVYSSRKWRDILFPVLVS